MTGKEFMEGQEAVENEVHNQPKFQLSVGKIFMTIIWDFKVVLLFDFICFTYLQPLYC